jgi:predicted dehydrogenase
MNKKLRFGIIGYGVVGPTHAHAINSLENTELMAVCDCVEERAKKAADEYGCRYYTDYRQLIADKDIDVVDICVPSGMHADIGIDVAIAGKHIICEKPIDVNLEKADKFIQTCRNNGVTLSVVSQSRFSDGIVKAKCYAILMITILGRLCLELAILNGIGHKKYFCNRCVMELEA